jgi:hypothetical protein
MKSGAVYGYRALVRIPVTSIGPFTGLSSKMGYMPGDLVTSLQADLALLGLIVTQYKVTGKTPNYGLALEIVPAKSFHSNQSVKSLVDQAIKQQTGALPAWSEDPSCCVVTPTTFGRCCCVTKQTLAMISPGGANPFAPGGSANAVVAEAPTNTLGAIYGAGATAVTDTENALKNAGNAISGPLVTTLIIVAGVGLLALFIFGKAGGHIG